MIKMSLNGQWDFVADLDPKYHDDKGIHGNHAYSKPNLNRRHWTKVIVPSVWQKYGGRYDIFEGVCWFVREFDTGKIGFTSARLRFGGVNYICDVYVNGQYTGGHEGGYTEFTLDATEHIRKGKNHIAVRVDNRATVIKWPTCLGYFNYGGIHREVTLELADGPYLYDVTLSAVRDAEGYRLCVNAAAADCGDRELTVRADCNGHCVTLPVSGGHAVGELAVRDAQSWSPARPTIYPVRVTLWKGNEVIDTYEIMYGFKTLAVKDGAIYLNGSPYTFRGICYVYDSSVSGLTMTAEQIETDVRLMKEMGANAVRCHYPMDRAFYEICDREGLLVWIEPPVYCYHPSDVETGTHFADGQWLSLANTMISEMVRSAKNHPCVAIYGIGNECNTANPEAEAFFTALAATVRKEDSTRLVSYAALYGIVGPLAELVDVLGINSYWGWYDKVFGGKGLAPEGESGVWALEREPIDLTAMRDMLDKVLSGAKSGLVMFLTEFGADSIPGFYAGGRDLWSEDYHAELLGEIFKLAEEYPQIVGTFPFCFTDYRDPSKTLDGYWNELNFKGAVSYNREKKLAFEAIRSTYK